MLTEGLVKHIEALPDGVVMRLGEALQQQQRQYLYVCTLKASKLSPSCLPRAQEQAGFSPRTRGFNASVDASKVRHSSELSTAAKEKSASGCK